MAIGSAAVEVVPDARAFWLRFQEQTRGGGARAGAEARREFDHAFSASGDRSFRMDAHVDTRDARRNVNDLQRSVSQSRHSIVADLAAFAPALIPLGAAAIAAGAELGALGATAALAFTGARREMEQLSPVGVEFTGVLSEAKAGLNQLQAVAARGVLPGVQQSVAQVKAELPQLSQVVASQSVLLGSTLSHLTSGLIGGFTTFQPVLDHVGESVERLAIRFDQFANGAGGASFARSLVAGFDQVGPVLGDVASALGHIVGAAGGAGSVILTEFGAIARAISAIPTPVLSVFITTLAAARLGLLAFRGAAAITGVVTAIGASLDGLRARFALSGLQAQAAAAQQAVASATIAGAAAAEAQFVAESKLAETTATLSAAEAAVATAGSYASAGAAVAASYAAEAEAVVAATRVEVVAQAQAAAIATETAAVKAGAAAAAADAQIAAASAAAAAQRTAGAGLLATLGPIGLVAAGLAILPALFGDSGDSADQAASGIQSYASALRESNGAITETIRTKVADAFKGQADEIRNLTASGITNYGELVTAVTEGGSKYDAVRGKLKGVSNAVRNTLREQRNQYVAGAADAKLYADAVTGAGTSLDNLVRSTKGGNTAFAGLAKAFTDFSKSEHSVADIGNVIGETLRAANGDAISYQNTINATAKANQQLVTDFANLKTGVLNLKKGTIDYHNAAAGPVLGDLQSLQDANVKAAAAVYQHFASTQGGARAAGNAFDVYKKNTQGALDTIGRKFGLEGKALSNFKNEYFGIKNAGDLKKRIEILGQDDVKNTLKSILEDLDILAGKRPLITVNADGKPAQRTVDGVTRAIDDIKQGRIPGIDVNTEDGQRKLANLESLLRHLYHPTIPVTIIPDFSRIPKTYKPPKGSKRGGGPNGDGSSGIGRATGGSAPEGLFAVGERGPEIVSKRGSNVQILSNEQSKSFIARTGFKFPGFAGGTEPGGFTGVDYSGDAGNGASRSKSKSAASKKKASDDKKKASKAKKAAKDLQDALKSLVSDAIGRVGQAYSAPFDLSEVGANRVGSTLGSAYSSLAKAVGRGLSGKSAGRLRSQLAGLVKLANRQLSNLRLKIKTTDVTALRSGLKDSVESTRTALSDLYSDLSKAGVNSRLLSGFKAAGRELVSLRGQLTVAGDLLEKMRDYSSGVADTLRGAFDATKFGSIDDLLQGFGDATGQHRTFTSEVSGLLKRVGKNKAGRAYITNLAEEGNTATLATLAGSSTAELNKVLAAVSGYNSSVAAGANITTVGKYGKSVATQQGIYNSIDRKMTSVADGLADLAGALGNAKFTFDGKSLDARIDKRTDKKLRELNRRVRAKVR